MPQIRRLLTRPASIATLAALLYALMILLLNQGDGLAFVTIGTRFDPGIAAENGGTEGYDGQFVYYIARDPSTAADRIRNGDDAPAYRFQRILLPALGMVFSLGNDSLIPFALLFVNIAALGIGTGLLATLLAAQKVSPYYALGWALSLGALGTVRLTLPETLAYALAIGGIYLMTKDKPLYAAGIFALAALAKETTLIFGAAAGLWLLLQRRPLAAIRYGLITLAPFVAWQIVLYQHFGEFGVGSGGAGATSFTPIPFGGVVSIIFEAARVVTEEINAGDISLFSGILRFLLGVTIFAVILVPFVLVPTLWGLQRAWERRHAPDLPTLLLALNAAVLLFVPFSTYREPLGILRFIAGLEIAVIWFAAKHGSARTRRYTTFFALTLLFLIFSDLAEGS